MSEEIQTSCMYQDDIECPVLPKIRKFIKIDDAMNKPDKPSVKVLMTGIFDSGAIVLQTLAMFCGNCNSRYNQTRATLNAVTPQAVNKASQTGTAKGESHIAPLFSCPYCEGVPPTTFSNPDALNGHIVAEHRDKHEDYKKKSQAYDLERWRKYKDGMD